MSENDDAVLNAAVGYVYVNTVGAAAPTPAQLKTINLKNPAAWSALGWSSVGHTSRGTLPEFGFEGGDTEVKGSWQKKKLRELETSDLIDFVTVILHQFDEEALGLYYGPNASSTPGVFGVKPGQVNEKAVFVVIEDQDLRLGHHAHKAGVKRDDAVDLPIDDLAALPIRFTYLDHEDELPFSWINEDLFNATAVLPHLSLGGATAGAFALKLDGVASEAINVASLTATVIRDALALLDDGISASEITVTAASGGFDIDVPATLTLGTSTATGGTVVLS